MKARQLSQDSCQEPTLSNGKSARDLTAERFVDSLVATGRYHDNEGKLDAQRLVRDVRAIETALILTRRAK